VDLHLHRVHFLVSNTALLITAVTCPEVTLCCENPFDVLAIGDGVDAELKPRAWHDHVRGRSECPVRRTF